MTRLTLVGATGRMGRAILSLMDERFELVEAMGRPGSRAIGQPLSDFVSHYPESQVLVDELTNETEVVVDFAAGPGLKEIVETCVKRKWALVSGRTGLARGDQDALEKASKEIAVLHAGNMSLGANLLFVLAAQAAQALRQADIEIFEAHHIHKKDAPSGTALALVNAIKEARGLKESDIIFGRSGETGEKPVDEIAVHALRSGETVGEHSVWYGLPAERVELTHKAFDRKIFASGALTAAAWIVEKPAGFWTMKDVLGL